MKKLLLGAAIAVTVLTQGCTTNPEPPVKSKSAVIGNHKEGYKQFSVSTFSADYVEQLITKDMSRMAIEHSREGNINIITVKYNNLLSATKYLDAGKFEMSIGGQDILEAIKNTSSEVKGAAVRVDAHINPTSNDNHDTKMVDKLIMSIKSELGDTEGKFDFTNKSGYRPLFENKKDFFNPNNRIDFVIYSYELTLSN